MNGRIFLARDRSARILAGMFSWIGADSADDLVVLVFDREKGVPPQTYCALRGVLGGHPKICHLLVSVAHFTPLDPERRTLGGLGLDPGHRKVVDIDPDFAALK